MAAGRDREAGRIKTPRPSVARQSMEPNRRVNGNRRAWSMSSRGVHKLHHDRCVPLGVTFQSDKVVSPAPPGEMPVWVPTSCGGRVSWAWVNCGEVVWVVLL